MAQWVNSDGLPVFFGQDQGRRKQVATGAGRLGVVKNDGEIQEAVLQLDLTGAARTMYTEDLNNDGTMDGFSMGLDTFLPNNAVIKEVIVETLVAPAGGTSYSVGTYQANGTAISATALVNAGTPMSSPFQLTQNAYVTGSTVGTYTAGSILVIIRYIPQAAYLKP